MRWSQEVLNQYYANGGDQRYRLDHYSNPKLIVEIGACDGTFTEKLADQFPGALIVAVEPVPSLFNVAQERLSGRDNVALTNIGLWTFEGVCAMTEDGPASSVSSSGVSVAMKEIAPWIVELGWIDLLVMNVEGAEYPLVSQLLARNAVDGIDNLQIQFHDVEADSYSLMLSAQQGLWKTHYPTYMYPFCMENWRLR